MKTAALIANIGFLAAMLWYLLTIQVFQAEGLELVVLLLAVGTPMLSILALVLEGRGTKTISPESDASCRAEPPSRPVVYNAGPARRED
jgi:hypothetical protein